MKSLSRLAGEKALPVRKLIIFAFLGAILIVAQVALAVIPNVELVSMLIIAYTRVLGKQTLFPIAVFVLGEGLIYGFGIWWINYLYIWAVLVAITLLLKKIQSVVLWALVSALFGLFYGALCALPYLFIGGVTAALAYWISGIPFDLIHCGGNFVAALLLMSPAYKLLNRLTYSLSTTAQIQSNTTP